MYLQFYKVLLVLLCALCAAHAHASSIAQLGLEEIATGLIDPVYISAAPGDSTRLYIIQQSGQILILSGGTISPPPLLNLSGQITTGNERGLLGLAFHPDYQSNGYLYVNYTRSVSSQLRTFISRFTVANPANPSAINLNTELIILSVVQPFSNHNAGMLAFSPRDNYLYIGLGDGGSGNDPFNHAQNLNSLLGKMLRIDVDLNGTGGGDNYDIPPDNPFYPSLSALDEIWAYGLRNPYRFSFDRLTGDLWLADVGQVDWEEVNFQLASSSGGQNYGWRTFEANQCNSVVATQNECDLLAPQATFPIHAYPNTEDGRAIVGGFVYRGTELPGLDGAYFFADYEYGRVWSFKGQNRENFTEWTDTLDPTGLLLPGLSSFGEDNNGKLYITVLGGSVYKLVNLAESEGEGQPVETHSADINADFILGLSELLRIIQFFNVFAFHCDPGTEDDYAPLAGDQSCASHSADYNPQDWSLSLSELLRVIQLFNADCFIPCGESEDGFCPVFTN